MLEGLMQDDFQLTLRPILDRMRTINGDSEVVTLTKEGKTRATYAEVGARVDRLCHALDGLGVKQGDRVASFCWNSQHHLEIYMALPCMGAVLHTLNLRLFPDQLTYIVNHAEDQIIFVDDSLVPLIEKAADTFEGVRNFIVIGDGDSGSLPNVLRYEDLIAEASSEPYDYPELDERTAAALCYTSGTTGNPRGVLYSHRSTVAHTLAECATDVFGICRADRVLPVVPMFHANAWGLPYCCAMTGADMIMPGPFLQAEPLAKLIEEEKPTIAGAVPTIWLDLLRYADEHKPDMSSLRLVPCGGSAVPLSLMKGFEERHGVKIIQAWGMTEMSPLGSVAHPPLDLVGDEAWAFRATAGQIAPFVEARIVAEDGTVQPWDGESTGELQVRGPWVVKQYYNDPDSAEKFDGDWLRTGDVACIDNRGYIRISDRSKDVIKSGGEWISSVELENELMAHPGVREAAVIAKPDERWSERPLACVVTEEDAPPAEELHAFLSERVAKWMVPDEFAYIAEIPKTGTGKFDKKVLRGALAEDKLEGRVLVEKAPA
ncbi:MAG: long-chain fatty acid--CoA ligase [Thermoleophilaceae bacterium]|nr:long-chain fatty acid--CoA ligase [Thermoleophilaceae bacterium]